MESHWAQLHPDICIACRVIAEAGKYDDAIFSAFRLVEAEVQSRIGSAAMGQTLLDEAFDGPTPKIDISPSGPDRIPIKQVFSAALDHIRNDRAQKKALPTPCGSLEECLLHLQFATLLLRLLDKDRNSSATRYLRESSNRTRWS